MEAIGRVGVLLAAALAVWSARVAFGAIGTGCQDADLLWGPSGYTLICSGACTGGVPCVRKETTLPSGDKRHQCVCDPTPGTNGWTDYSGDETLDTTLSSCVTNMIIHKLANGNSTYDVACATASCANPCNPADDGQEPDPGSMWCDCP